MSINLNEQVDRQKKAHRMRFLLFLSPFFPFSMHTHIIQHPIVQNWKMQKRKKNANQQKKNTTILAKVKSRELKILILM